MSENDTSVDFVESVISNMVEGDLDAQDAVAQVLDGEMIPESVQFDPDEGDPVCLCGNEDLQYGVTETELGEAPTIYCPACDTGYVADLEEDEDTEEEMEEAEIDPENPQCPVCESDDIEGDFIEDGGEKIPVLVCKSCGTGYVPTGEED